MKRSFVILAALLVCIVLPAQGLKPEKGFEFSVGYGLWPSIQANRIEPLYVSDYSSLEALYRPFSSKQRMTGAVTLEVGYRFDSRWTLSLMGSYTHCFSMVGTQLYNTPSGKAISFLSSSDINADSFALIPKARFDWFVRPYFRLYSSAGLGLGCYVGFKERGSSRYSGNVSIENELQVVPIGASFGKKWFGFIEAGVGTQFAGGRAGAGYRF